MDKTTAFLMANKRILGEKVLNSLERWFFPIAKLPAELRSKVQSGHVGVYLSERPDGTWHVAW